MIFKSKDANYDFGALISNKGFVMVDISEQSLVFHLYFQKKKLARTFKIFQAQKMFLNLQTMHLCRGGEGKLPRMSPNAKKN